MTFVKAIQVYYIHALMATHALTLRVHLLGRQIKNIYVYFFWGGAKKIVKRTRLIRSITVIQRLWCKHGKIYCIH